MTLYARGTYPNGHRFLIGFASEAKLRTWAAANKAEITEKFWK
jgi:hypothetical protein